MSELFEQEPQLDAAEIQGNILAGFNKNGQWLLGLVIDGVAAPGSKADPAVRAAKAWVASLAPRIATMDRVAEHNRWFRQERRRTGREPVSEQVWTHIAFTYPGLVKLTGTAAEAFTHLPFRLGLAARSSFLGDPTDPTAEGHPRNWRVGGPANPIDILLIIAGDYPQAVKRAVRQMEKSVRAARLRIVYKEEGKVRTDEVDGLCMHGHEHFGFKDGISQPALRGWFRLPDGAAVPVTHRELPPGAPLSQTYAAPGQPLVQSGEFVFGYPRQHDRKPAESVALTLEAQGVPAWAKNGSFLAFRRLRQDVALFRRTVAQRARQLPVDREWLGSRIVGRWPSGAPLMRAPERDDRALGADRLARNNFQFANAGMLDVAETGRPRSQADPLGLTCPIAAHIRKVNPRDEATDAGSLAGTLTRRIIRRGMPFGDPLPPGDSMPDGGPLPDGGPDRGERGLLFLSYQTSLEDQFEFLQNNWMNRTAAPNLGGHDPLLGQNPLAENRERRFQLGPGAEVTGLPDFVIPTGGAYLFSPSIAALRDVLGS
jgi:Dyp-type peroxidase family